MSRALCVASFWGLAAFVLLTLQLLLIPGFDGVLQWPYGIVSGVTVLVTTRYLVRAELACDQPWSKWRSRWLRVGCVAGFAAATSGALVYAIDMTMQSYASGFRYADVAFWPLSTAFLWILDSLAACPVAAVEGLVVAVVSLPLLRLLRDQSCQST